MSDLGTHVRRVGHMDPFRYYRHLRRTQRYVEDHLTEPIGLADVARNVGLSPSHYSAFFHRATGQRFSVWLRRQRIDRAKRLLRECDQPIYRIAIDVGFRSLSAFERAFKISELVSPSMYRKISLGRSIKGFEGTIKRKADDSTI